MSSPWYQPVSVRDAVDCLEDLACVNSFLRDSIPTALDAEYSLSVDGTNGYAFILMFIENTTRKCADIISKEAV